MSSESMRGAPRVSSQSTSTSTSSASTSVGASSKKDGLRGMPFEAQEQALAPGPGPRKRRGDAGADKPDTGNLPSELRASIEQLAGVDMSGVRVHYNSARPAKLGAFAFAEGDEIHLAPGQESQLPHEAWHIAQQRSGRVAATVQMKGKQVNGDSALEREADVMGARAAAQRGGDGGAPKRGTRGVGVAQLAAPGGIEHVMNSCFAAAIINVFTVTPSMRNLLIAGAPAADGDGKAAAPPPAVEELRGLLLRATNNVDANQLVDRDWMRAIMGSLSAAGVIAGAADAADVNEVLPRLLTTLGSAGGHGQANGARAGVLVQWAGGTATAAAAAQLGANLPNSFVLERAAAFEGDAPATIDLPAHAGAVQYRRTAIIRGNDPGGAPADRGHFVTYMDRGGGGGAAEWWESDDIGASVRSVADPSAVARRPASQSGRSAAATSTSTATSSGGSSGARPAAMAPPTMAAAMNADDMKRFAGLRASVAGNESDDESDGGDEEWDPDAESAESKQPKPRVGATPSAASPSAASPSAAAEASPKPSAAAPRGGYNANTRARTYIYQRVDQAQLAQDGALPTTANAPPAFDMNAFRARYVALAAMPIINELKDAATRAASEGAAPKSATSAGHAPATSAATPAAATVGKPAAEEKKLTPKSRDPLPPTPGARGEQFDLVKQLIELSRYAPVQELIARTPGLFQLMYHRNLEPGQGAADAATGASTAVAGMRAKARARHASQMGSGSDRLLSTAEKIDALLPVLGSGPNSLGHRQQSHAGGTGMDALPVDDSAARAAEAMLIAKDVASYLGEDDVLFPNLTHRGGPMRGEQGYGTSSASSSPPGLLASAALASGPAAASGGSAGPRGADDAPDPRRVSAAERLNTMLSSGADVRETSETPADAHVRPGVADNGFGAYLSTDSDTYYGPHGVAIDNRHAHTLDLSRSTDNHDSLRSERSANHQFRAVQQQVPIAHAGAQQAASIFVGTTPDQKAPLADKMTPQHWRDGVLAITPETIVRDFIRTAAGLPPLEIHNSAEHAQPDGAAEVYLLQQLLIELEGLYEPLHWAKVWEDANKQGLRGAMSSLTRGARQFATQSAAEEADDGGAPAAAAAASTTSTAPTSAAPAPAKPAT